MIQGTTPTISIRLPMDAGTLTAAEFVLRDYDGTERTWDLDRMAADGDVLKLRLTQEETFSLHPGTQEAQLRVKTADGEVMATRIMRINVHDLISDEVL